MPSHDNSREENARDAVDSGLTYHPESVHCAATQNTGGSDTDELERIAIDHLLDILARIALAIAARECSENKDQERDD